MNLNGSMRLTQGDLRRCSLVMICISLLIFPVFNPQYCIKRPKIVSTVVTGLFLLLFFFFFNINSSGELNKCSVLTKRILPRLPSLWHRGFLHFIFQLPTTLGFGNVFFEIDVSLFCASVLSLLSPSTLNKCFKAVFVQPNSCHFNY